MMFLGLNKKFFFATSVLVGSMVGVGIFGLPYAFSIAGYGPSMMLLLLIGSVTLLVNLMYGEVILRTHEKHQLLGYSKVYLSPIFQKLFFFVLVLIGYVGLLAYIIISGDFLNTLLSSFFFAPVAAYSVIFAIVASLVVLRGIKTVSHVELLFSCLFMVIVGLIFASGFRAIDPANYIGFNRADIGIPYGVLLFAFGGLLGLPIQRQLLTGEERKFRLSIILAMFFTACLYVLFTTTVVGISGSSTSQDAVSGLFEFIGGKITVLSALFGVFAITTSYLMLSSALANTFHLDFKVKKFNAWMLAVVPPFVLFLVGIRSFIAIISLAGGVALALEQILVVFLYARAKSRGDRIPEYSLNIPIWLLYLLILVFTVGIIYFLFIQ